MKLILALALLIGLTVAAVDDACAGAGNTTGVESPCGVCCAGDTGVDCTTGMDCFGECGGNATSAINVSSLDDLYNDILSETVSPCDVCDVDSVPSFNSTSCFGTCYNFIQALFLNDARTTAKRDLGSELIHDHEKRLTAIEIAIINIRFGAICGPMCTLTEDCNGECGGTATINECDICVGGTTNLSITEGRDCAGVCNGNATLNECGSCILPSNYPTCEESCSAIIDNCGNTIIEITLCQLAFLNCIFGCNNTVVEDCNGDCGGTAYTNECGYCVGGNTNKTDDFGLDCNGDCDGTAAIDDCGICAGGNTLEIPNEDKDCAGVCFGTSTIDPCGVCGGNSTIGDCCNCPRSAGYWKTHTCFSRCKSYRRGGRSKRLKRSWPGDYSDCDEETCGIQWKNILWGKARGNAWTILARQYVAAELNLENIPCYKNTAASTQVQAWIDEAKALLESNCASIGKLHPDRTRALELKDLLESFNTLEDPSLFLGVCNDDDDGNDGPDNDDDDDLSFPGDGDKRRSLRGKEDKMVRTKRLDRETRIDTACFEATVIQNAVVSDSANIVDLDGEGILPGDPLLQCVAGRTLNSLYWAEHNGELLHPQTEVEWLAGSTLELCTVCDQTLLSLITVDPFLTNNSFQFVAHEWIAAVVNIRNGACLTQVAADALFDALELIESACPVVERGMSLRGHNESHDFVSASSDLGQAFMELHDQLESFNNQEWGPYESLLDELREKLDDDDCTEETQRGYLIWAIVVTICLVLAFCAMIAIIVIMSTRNMTAGGGGRAPPLPPRNVPAASRYQTRIEKERTSDIDDTFVWGSSADVHQRRPRY